MQMYVDNSQDLLSFLLKSQSTKLQNLFQFVKTADLKLLLKMYVEILHRFWMPTLFTMLMTLL